MVVLNDVQPRSASRGVAGETDDDEQETACFPRNRNEPLGGCSAEHERPSLPAYYAQAAAFARSEGRVDGISHPGGHDQHPSTRAARSHHSNVRPSGLTATT
jgi:hypothetical protein